MMERASEPTHLLLRLGTPVSIPDAVFKEATRIRTAGGASAIVEWVSRTTKAEASAAPRC
jgi:hypothetical protein